MTLDFAQLSAPFPADEIEWRVGHVNGEKTKGLALAYLTARHVMDRLDAVCGPGGWQDRYEFHGSRTICYLSLRVGNEWLTKADGAGDSDVEAEKGSISDALKRGAVKWGIGRYLYETNNIWVEVEASGKSYRIKESEKAKLVAALNKQFGAVKAGTAKAAVIVTDPGEMQTLELKRIFKSIQKAIRDFGNITDLSAYWSADEIVAQWKRLPQAGKDALEVEFANRYSELDSSTTKTYSADAKNLGQHLDAIDAGRVQ